MKMTTRFKNRKSSSGILVTRSESIKYHIHFFFFHSERCELFFRYDNEPDNVTPIFFQLMTLPRVRNFRACVYAQTHIIINNTKSTEIKQTLVDRYRVFLFPRFPLRSNPRAYFPASPSSLSIRLSAPLRKRRIILAVRSPHCATLHYLYPCLIITPDNFNAQTFASLLLLFPSHLRI